MPATPWVRAAVFAGVAVAVSLLPEPAAAQCAMCKATLENSANDLGATFNRAILVMMAAPYLVMGVFGAVFFRERLRDKARRLLARARRAVPGRGR